MQSLPRKPQGIGSTRFVIPPGKIVGFALTIKFVPDNRVADSGKVDTKLMCPAGKGLQRYQRILPGQCLRCDDLRAACLAAFNNTEFIRNQRILQFSDRKLDGPFRGNSMNDGIVAFFDPPGIELPAKRD